jgi:hypothetical protein
MIVNGPDSAKFCSVVPVGEFADPRAEGEPRVA